MFKSRWGETRVWVGEFPNLLERLVASEAGVSPADVVVTHSCATCGSSDHGMPSVVLPMFVSRSRAGGYTAAALGPRPIGVDIESLDRLSRASVEPVLLHSAEAVWLSAVAGAQRLREIASLWTAKEAVLKLAGTGLRIDPASLRMARSEGLYRLVEWPDELRLSAEPTLHHFDVGTDLVGCVAIAAA